MLQAATLSEQGSRRAKGVSSSYNLVRFFRRPSALEAGMSVRRNVVLFAAVAAAMAFVGWQVEAQAPATPTNDAPNPYTTIEGFFKLPEGRKWGSTSAVDISPDGKFIWVAERCGTNSCLDRATGQMSNLPPILKFEQSSGKLVASFGEGMLIFPHGIHIDRQGNVWVTDGQDNAPTPARGGAAGGGAAGGGGGAGAAAGGGAAGAGGQAGAGR